MAEKKSFFDKLKRGLFMTHTEIIEKVKEAMTPDLPIDRSALQLMTDSIAHRGPDGHGFHLAPGICLGQRRLAIIDPRPEGRQPMTVRCSKCSASSLEDLALTYNGEIYNFKELRSELLAAGHILARTRLPLDPSFGLRHRRGDSRLRRK